MRFRPSLLAGLLLACLPLLAHHSLEAQYDPDHLITLTGTVTKIDWSNPHVHFFVDVKRPNATVNWDVEMGSPNAQILSGWKIDTIRPGDAITVSVYPARDGAHIAYARKLAKTGH